MPDLSPLWIGRPTEMYSDDKLDRLARYGCKAFFGNVANDYCDNINKWFDDILDYWYPTPFCREPKGLCGFLQYLRRPVEGREAQVNYDLSKDMEGGDLQPPSRRGGAPSIEPLKNFKYNPNYHPDKVIMYAAAPPRDDVVALESECRLVNGTTFEPQTIINGFLKAFIFGNILHDESFSYYGEYAKYEREKLMWLKEFDPARSGGSTGPCCLMQVAMTTRVKALPGYWWGGNLYAPLGLSFVIDRAVHADQFQMLSPDPHAKNIQKTFFQNEEERTATVERVVYYYVPVVTTRWGGISNELPKIDERFALPLKLVNYTERDQLLDYLNDPSKLQTRYEIFKVPLPANRGFYYSEDLVLMQAPADACSSNTLDDDGNPEDPTSYEALGPIVVTTINDPKWCLNIATYDHPSFNKRKTIFNSPISPLNWRKIKRFDNTGLPPFVSFQELESLLDTILKKTLATPSPFHKTCVRDYKPESIIGIDIATSKFRVGLPDLILKFNFPTQRVCQVRFGVADIEWIDMQLTNNDDRPPIFAQRPNIMENYVPSYEGDPYGVGSPFPDQVSTPLPDQVTSDAGY